MLFLTPPSLKLLYITLTCNRQQLQGLIQVLREAAGRKVTHADAGAAPDVCEELHVDNLAEVAERDGLRGALDHRAPGGVRGGA